MSMSAPSQFGSSPQPAGGGGSSVLVIVLVVLLVLFVGCGGLCGGCLYFAGKGATAVQKGIDEGMKLVQLAAAYSTTESTVLSDPQVIDRLGQPIERTTEPKRQNAGDLKPAGETFQFDIKGPKATAIVSAVATADSGPFKVTQITVTFSDGSVVDVKPPADQVDPTDLKIETK
jgi:hypothetical protein